MKVVVYTQTSWENTQALVTMLFSAGELGSRAGAEEWLFLSVLFKF